MEIKSRMWDLLKKEMRYEPFLKTGDRSGDWIIFLSDQIKIDRHKDCLMFNAPYPRERFVETRYTNIRDKDKKEIYEGDIMRARLSNIHSMSQGRVFKSKIVIGDVRIRPIGGTGIIALKVEPADDAGIQVGTFLKIKRGRDEIVGNVFENFEIIKEVSK